MDARASALRRRRAGAVLALAVAASTGTSARAASSQPTLGATTSVTTTTVPPLVNGAWMSNDGVWSLDLDSVSPPLGTTTVTATWRSPTIKPIRNQILFAVGIDVRNENGNGAYGYSDRVRLCTRRGCGAWIDESSDSVPSTLSADTVPYTVVVGHGMSVRWRASRDAAWVEWRYVQRQRDLTGAQTTIQMAVGDAAKRVP